MNAVVEPVSLELIEQDKPAGRPLVTQPADSAPRQLSVVEYAIQNNAPVDQVRALVELQIQMDNHKLEMRKRDDEREREQRAEAAREAYNEAMAAFKAEAPRVVRSKDITDGPLKGKKHADLFAVTSAVTALMSKHGLTASWVPLEDSEKWIRIECRVKHVAGHSEAVAFGGPVDTGPGRNAIQARKSTSSYLQRLTLELALGLAESDADDDGSGGAGGAANDIGALLADLRETTSDSAAHAFWLANRDALRDHQPTYDKFKDEVIAHRRALQKGGI